MMATGFKLAGTEWKYIIQDPDMVVPYQVLPGTLHFTMAT